MTAEKKTAATKASLIVVLLSNFFHDVAQAETFIECRGSFGYSFFQKSELLPESKDEWSEDGISDGIIALVSSEDGGFDILVSDAMGLKSLQSYGASIIPIGTGEETASFFVKYSNTVFETYTFNLVKKQVFWTQQKHEQIISKVGSFVSDCL